MDESRAAIAAPGLRLARAAALAAVALATGLTAHRSTGGTTPPAGEVVLLLAALTASSALTLGRPASTRLVLLLLLGSQAAIHLVLSLASGAHHHSGVLGSPAAHQQPTTAPPALAWLDHLLAGVDALMLAAHLVAFVAVGLWLAAGERALWALLVLAARPLAASVRSLLGHPLPALPGYVDRVGGACRAATADALLPAARTLAHRVVAHRGPPALPV